MKKNRRQNILDGSRKLFNSLGFSQVTIRMIASELGFSSGNLNYHFRKRADILEALYFEMVEVFDKRIQDLPDAPISLAHLQTEVQASMHRMVEYRFFWTDLYHLLKSNQKIQAHFEGKRKERIDGYHFFFEALIKQCILQPATFSQEYSLLSERMIDYSNTWLYASNLYENNNKTTAIIKRASYHLLSMLYPYLTNQGKEEFKQLYSSFFIDNSSQQ